MSITNDNLLDRLLRYAPWAAAALVGICVIALVARVVSKASSTSEPDEIAASAGAAGNASQKQPTTAPHVALRPDLPTALEGRHTGEAQTQPAEITRPAAAARWLKEPQTPSSKSRLEMHGVRRGTPQGEAQPKLAAKATTKTFIASSRSADLSSTMPAAAPAIVEQQIRQGSIGQGSTLFFGIEANGQRFAYVLDRSGSMSEPQNKPLRAAKAELLASLDRLDGLQQFFLIFYNEDVRQFVPGVRGHHFADDGNKRSARRFVESVQAQGGTRHFEALQRAINLRPDVIFLLTDGEPKDDLTADELKRLNRLNGGLAQIHVIQFAAAPYSGNSLAQLAKENRGEHTYKSMSDVVKTVSAP